MRELKQAAVAALVRPEAEGRKWVAKWSVSVIAGLGPAPGDPLQRYGNPRPISRNADRLAKRGVRDLAIMQLLFQTQWATEIHP